MLFGEATNVGIWAHQDDVRVAILALGPFVGAWFYNLGYGTYLVDRENDWFWLIATLLFAGAFTFWVGGARSVVTQFFPQQMVVGRRRAPTVQARTSKESYRGKLVTNKDNVPPLNVVIMITGTHGDVAPFVALGLELRRRYKHRIRFATHSTHRDFVIKQGLEFYPLAGDPKVLSQWMVQSEGRLLPNFNAPLQEIQKELTEIVPKKTAMINAIMESTWAACVDALPDGSSPFIAHAIISNPVTYGHIHCASALRIPLHMAFPQPWTPTGDYPHPFITPTGGLTAPTSEMQRSSNWMTYYVFDELSCLALNLNQWRSNVLNLSPLLGGDRAAHVLNDLEVPFAYMWSNCLAPKPEDWGLHIDVVGTLVHDTGAAAGPPAGSEELQAFLANGEKPIFIGFGSMVIDNPEELFDMIVEASKQAGARVVVQSSWSKLGADGTEVPGNICCVGNCSHTWLLPQCGGAIHHGGAGTVAAGLRMGLPTFIVPFFGDQHFWGEMVRRAGAGPPPCPYAQLTTARLAEAIQTLRSESTREKARLLAQEMMEEDGVANMCEVFTKHLPVHSMVCMVSLFADTEPRIVVAEKWHMNRKVPLSAEAHAVLQDDVNLRTRTWMDYGYILWDAHAPVSDVHTISAVPLNTFSRLQGVAMVLISPFADFIDVINTFKKSSARTIPDVTLTAACMLCLAILELPVRLVAALVAAMFSGVSNISQVLITCTIGRVWRNHVRVRARHPGIRPEVDVKAVPTGRRESILRAAVVADHVLPDIALVQGRRRGDLKPWLDREQVTAVLSILLNRTPDAARSKYQSYYLGACMRRRALRRLRKAPPDPRVKMLVDTYAGTEGMSTVNFCLFYGKWLQDGTLKTMDAVTRSVKLEMATEGANTLEGSQGTQGDGSPPQNGKPDPHLYGAAGAYPRLER